MAKYNGCVTAKRLWFAGARFAGIDGSGLKGGLGRRAELQMFLHHTEPAARLAMR